VSDYYRDELPMKELARSIADEVYVFQQNNAPVRRERETVQLLRRKTAKFIPLDMCPAYSPHLNPLDYRISRVMPERICANIERGRSADTWPCFSSSRV